MKVARQRCAINKNSGKKQSKNHTFFSKKLYKNGLTKKAERLLTLPYWRTGSCDTIWISQVFK
jgi:hypothetical protein